MPFMWSLLNPFYLSVTRCTTQRQRREREEGGENRKKKKKNMQVQAWRGGDEYHRRILPTKALRRATGVLYLLTAKTQEQERGMWVPEHLRGEMHFVLTVPYVCAPPQSPKWALKDRSVISGDEVMHATCSIMSSDFGHGLVKAEP